jgi:hypothetical protein
MLGDRRALGGVVAAGGLAALVVVLVLSAGAERSGRWSVGASEPAGSHARFVFLASRSSNQCGLRAAALDRYGTRERLQGSCCSAMDERAYREQVRRLRAHRGLAQIPRDPYDIPIPLVRRLLRYDRGISLTGAQRRAYARAMALSDQKGPCCCRCWRWSAFRGLAKYLIAEQRWRPRRLANLIDLLEGCGGPRRHHSRTATS